MTGFKTRMSGVGSDHSTNWATSTAQETLTLDRLNVSLAVASCGRFYNLRPRSQRQPIRVYFTILANSCAEICLRHRPLETNRKNAWKWTDLFSKNFWLRMWTIKATCTRWCQARGWTNGEETDTHNWLGSGCDAVGRAVASDARGPRFDSSHRQLLVNIYLLLLLAEKTKNKEKEAWNCPLIKNRHTTQTQLANKSIYGLNERYLLRQIIEEREREKKFKPN